MLELNIDDVLAVLGSIRVYLIAIGVVLALALIATMSVNKATIKNGRVRKLTHSSAWIVAAIAAVVSINMMLLGPLSSVITLSTSAKLALSDATIEKTNNLAVDMEREGSVLLQNNDNTLPIANPGNINVFGWASTNPIYGGTGSGALSDAYPTTSILDSLNDAGFKTNEELSKFYTDYSTSRGEIAVTKADWTLPEPPATQYSQSLMDNAKNYSDTAVVVIGRVGGEGLDLPKDMNAEGVVYNNNSTEYKDFEDGQHYLELDRTEKDMLDLVTSNFDKVVLVYNGANAFEMSFLNDYPQIKSVVWTPHPGQAGFKALGEILNGTVNPSGKTADTFIKDFTASPSFNNFGDFKYDNVQEFAIESARGVRSPRFVNYVEGIYVGYRFYETAADVGAINYDDVVQYPFGYGLSYTSFSQSMSDVTYANGTVSFTVTVTNTGSVAGKDVVEAYYNPPYTEGGIEKATANLVAYEKTSELQPGQSEDVQISFNDDDMASYDYQNAKAYVLEQGDYAISIRSDSHHIIDSKNITVDSTVTYNSADNTHSQDQQVATNAFDDVAGDVTYLSRAQNFANYAQATAAPTNYSMSDEVKATYYNNGNYDSTQFDNPSDTMPTTGAKNGVRLADLRGKDYDDEQWDALLDELTVDEMNELIANGGYGNAAIASIGKIRLSDVDGPAALKDNFTGVSSIGLPANVVLANSWNKDLAKQFGENIGEMAHELNITGWYAPSINMHRSEFGGRNFEYFSEDPTLTGTLASGQVMGAAEYGVYAFTKHFALNEQETQRNGQLTTWSNEQAIREIYLKPFETVVKTANEGNVKSMAIMSSFNYIGNTYTSAKLALNQTVLRDEWGFRGMVETDYFSGPNYSYQNADQLIRGGTDIMLATAKTTNYVTNVSATAVKEMRRAAHNILYTTVNSWAYENGEPQSHMDAWKITLIVVDVILGLILAGLLFIAIRRFIARGKQAEIQA
ncbi:glycoside hydrolase family 3 protein [Alloscardovia criceti]|uniref:glycoside hydrolase family 3 protein n=1 Tax=Alloscardovia criceti TaxID=356828 RepID=UPI0003755E45|nr:glycoside hydrolase family 3 protein [Alloscardovia criceti]